MSNDLLILVLSAAFAPPLLKLINEPSGGIHLHGDSRIGKSTAIRMAASVWGKPSSEGQMRTWRATANGLEAVAAEATDTPLILDEMGQADPHEVGEVIYMVGNEVGKTRATRTGAADRRQSWRIFLISTGEVTLEQKLEEAGKRGKAGMAARLLNIPADAGKGLGIFQELHGRANSGEFVEELERATKTQHGTAASAFLSELTKPGRVEKAQQMVTCLRERFIAKYVPNGADGQVRSAASRFALIGAAGEVARTFGILPWPEGRAMQTAVSLFQTWLSARGSAGPKEDEQMLSAVRGYLERHGESRFPIVHPGAPRDGSGLNASKTFNRAGFRRRLDHGGWEYMIFPTTWKRDVCKGFDPSRVADLLRRNGLLIGAQGRHPAAAVRIPGEKVMRLYCVSSAVLCDGEADEDETGAVGGSKSLP